MLASVIFIPPMLTLAGVKAPLLKLKLVILKAILTLDALIRAVLHVIAFAR
jgi:hypothetical protein